MKGHDSHFLATLSLNLKMSAISLVILLMALTCSAQAPKQDARIVEIRKEFQRIEQAKLEKVELRLYDPYDPHAAIAYTAWYDQGELVKLATIGGESEFIWRSTYYLKDAKVFFVYEVESEADIEETQYRYYLHQGELIKALVKSGKPPLARLPNKPLPSWATQRDSIAQKLQSGFEYLRTRYRWIEPQRFRPQFSSEQKKTYLQAIRNEFQRIEQADLQEREKGFESQYGYDMGQRYQYKGYFEKGALVKFLVKETATNQTTTYYLKNDQLFFVYDVSYIGETEKNLRLYLKDAQLIQALEKSGKSPLDRIPNKPISVCTKDIQERMLKQFQRFEASRERAEF